MKVILDCDVGTDDAQAILIAIAEPTVNLLAVTTVFGNTTLENTTYNVLRVLKIVNRLDIPVYRGCSTSLIGDPPVGDGFHGKDGLGDSLEDDPPDRNLIHKEHASLALIRLVNQYKGEITLVATGPLTNLAVALKLDPDLGIKLNKCVIMGGNTTGRGNVSVCGEFNFVSDPEAAKAVLKELKCTPTVVDLQICESAAFSWDWYDKFTNQPTHLAAFIKRVEKYTIEQRLRLRPGSCYTAIWDQLAMAIAINPQVALETFHVFATVECQGHLTRGQMVVEWRKHRQIDEPNINLVTKVDKQLFEKYLLMGIGVTE